MKLIDQQNYVDRVQFAQTKKAEGMTVNEVALLLHSFVKTIQKYLKLDTDKVIARGGSPACNATKTRRGKYRKENGLRWYSY